MDKWRQPTGLFKSGFMIFYIVVFDQYSVISKVTKWDHIERALVIPCMFYSGLMMVESRPKHVALM
jgi:hypothetical protein